MIRKPTVALFLAFALATPISINPLSQTDSAEAASCRNRGGASERFSYSSQVNGTVFTLCGKAIFKLLPKPRQSAKATPKPKSQPKPSPAPKTKRPVVSKPKKRSDDGYAAFRPRRPVATVENNSVLSPQQPVEFAVDSTTHFRRARILGHAARVRFRPIEFGWSFSDGQVLEGPSVSRSFSEKGVYQAVATVRFEVAYRFDSGAAWVVDPERIQLVSNRLLVEVGQQMKAKRVKLVNRNCIESPTALGCRNP